MPETSFNQRRGQLRPATGRHGPAMRHSRCRVSAVSRKPVGSVCFLRPPLCPSRRRTPAASGFARTWRRCPSADRLHSIRYARPRGAGRYAGRGCPAVVAARRAATAVLGGRGAPDAGAVPPFRSGSCRFRRCARQTRAPGVAGQVGLFPSIRSRENLRSHFGERLGNVKRSF